MNTYCPYCMCLIAPGKVCPGCGKDPSKYISESHHFPAGKILNDRYYVGQILGEGGFGITYLGFDTKLERKVAIKEYFPRALVRREVAVTLNVTCYTGSDEYFEKGREQFLKEARALAKLDDIPEIVQVLDFFPANNSAYIVMEFLEGTTLKDLVAQRGGCLPANELLSMMEPVIKGLDAMHATGLIHRDISPDNLMLLKKGGRVKLMDFGCAREIGNGHTMTVMLKPGFAPTEQYTGHEQGPWTDVYGMSATLYYCLTGKVPPEAMRRLVSDEIVSISSVAKNSEKAILKGLEVNAKDRWQNASQLYAALYGKTIGGIPVPDPFAEPADATVSKTEAVLKDEKAPAATEHIAAAPGKDTSGNTEYISINNNDSSIKTEYISSAESGDSVGNTEYINPPASNESSKSNKALILWNKLCGMPLKAKAATGIAACVLLIMIVAVILLAGPLSSRFSSKGSDLITNEQTEKETGKIDTHTKDTTSADTTASDTTVADTTGEAITSPAETTGPAETKPVAVVPDTTTPPQTTQKPPSQTQAPTTQKPATTKEESTTAAPPSTTPPVETLVKFDAFNLKLSGNGKSYSVEGKGSSSEKAATVPASYNGIPVTKISANAFYKHSNLESITLPGSISVIEQSAFCDCSNLESINLPKNLTTIGDSAFMRCKSLQNLVIPNSVTVIGENAFAECTSLSSLTLSSNLTSIEAGTFKYCTSLKSVTIPSKVTILKEDCFYNCTALVDVTIPSSVTLIERGAFYFCDDLKVTLPSGCGYYYESFSYKKNVSGGNYLGY